MESDGGAVVRLSGRLINNSSSLEKAPPPPQQTWLGCKGHGARIKTKLSTLPHILCPPNPSGDAHASIPKFNTSFGTARKLL